MLCLYICLGKAILKDRGTESSSAGLTPTQPHQEVCFYERSQDSPSLLPRISYSSTSSAEPESESRMEPWELNWDPLSVAMRPARKASQPGHQWKCSKGALTAVGDGDSQVWPGKEGWSSKMENITGSERNDIPLVSASSVINGWYLSHYGLQ